MVSKVADFVGSRVVI